MNVRQVFLLITAIGLFPIALSYGLMPQKSLGYLFDISVSYPNSSHILLRYSGLFEIYAGGFIARDFLFGLIVFNS